MNEVEENTQLYQVYDMLCYMYKDDGEGGGIVGELWNVLFSNLVHVLQCVCFFFFSFTIGMRVN